MIIMTRIVNCFGKHTIYFVSFIVKKCYDQFLTILTKLFVSTIQILQHFYDLFRMWLNAIVSSSGLVC